MNEYGQARRQAEWSQERIPPKARETVRVTQIRYGEVEFRFLRILDAQRKRKETELSYLQSQGTRWANATEIASLLQREDFPLTLMTPAVTDPELVKQENAAGRQSPEQMPPLRQ